MFFHFYRFFYAKQTRRVQMPPRCPGVLRTSAGAKTADLTRLRRDSTHLPNYLLPEVVFFSGKPRTSVCELAIARRAVAVSFCASSPPARSYSCICIGQGGCGYISSCAPVGICRAVLARPCRLPLLGEQKRCANKFANPLGACCTCVDRARCSTAPNTPPAVRRLRVARVAARRQVLEIALVWFEK
jgi:hypothetical protein